MCQGVIDQHGAVSREVASAMAEGIRKRVYRATEWGLQASQARGRKRAEAVGLVYIALAGEEGTQSSSEISPATASVFVSSQRSRRWR